MTRPSGRRERFLWTRGDGDGSADFHRGEIDDGELVGFGHRDDERLTVRGGDGAVAVRGEGRRVP